MADLKDPRWIWAKGILFLIAGLLAVGLVWIEVPRFKVLLLLGVAIWCFCRSYYFAFYVIQHYIDSRYRFAGLIDFVRYLCGDTARHAQSTAAESSGNPAGDLSGSPTGNRT